MVCGLITGCFSLRSKDALKSDLWGERIFEFKKSTILQIQKYARPYRFFTDETILASMVFY
jgi:hypothetical protein